jgi:hypothetical protein
MKSHGNIKAVMRHGFSAVTPELAMNCSMLLIGLSFLVWHEWWLFHLMVWKPKARAARVRAALVHSPNAVAATLLGSFAVAYVRSSKMNDEAHLLWTAVVIASPTTCTCLAIALERRRQSTGPHVTDFVFGCALLASLVICALGLVGIAPPGFDYENSSWPGTLALQLLVGGPFYGGIPAAVIRVACAALPAGAASVARPHAD